MTLFTLTASCWLVTKAVLIPGKSIVNPPCYTEEEAVLNRGGYLVEVFSGPSWLYPFGADSLSRSVHCAADENDRPSERTKCLK